MMKGETVMPSSSNRRSFLRRVSDGVCALGAALACGWFNRTGYANLVEVDAERWPGGSAPLAKCSCSCTKDSLRVAALTGSQSSGGEKCGCGCACPGKNQDVRNSEHRDDRVLQQDRRS
jgi:hypothetical protein